MSAFIFDLDGTLVDTVYAHVMAWQKALDEAGVFVDAWRIHRRIGMSGGLLMRALSQEIGRNFTPGEGKAIDDRHSELFNKHEHAGKPLRGAIALLKKLKHAKIPFAIATSGTRPGIDPSLKALSIDSGVVVVEGKKAGHPKPEPDEFYECQSQLGVKCEECFVVGDAVWDLLAAGRAKMFGIGLLSGGTAAEELFKAGAFRVYSDTAELVDSLYQLGIE